ncbi:MAG: hypothetical protein ACLF0G_06415 [Candidatus Brocadiia bacterium]
MLRGTLAVGLLLAAGAGVLAEGGGVVLDVEDVPLSRVLELLAAQDGPTLAPTAEVAEQKVRFAVKTPSSYGAARWLCREAGLVVVAKGGRLVIGRPPVDEAESKDYRITKLVRSDEEGEALVSFLRQVVFAAYPRRTAADGQLKPRLEAAFSKGRLRVLGPPMVQREVLGLLRAAAAARKPRSGEDLEVTYHRYEIGLFGPWQAGHGPPLRGEVTLDADAVEAPEVARALTSQAPVSFFIDPWEETLRGRKVTLRAEGEVLATVVERLEKQLFAERVWYDGAWVFVRAARRPIFEGLVVRVYNISGDEFGGMMAALIERRVRALRLGGDLPYGVERVGERYFTSATPEAQEVLERLFQRAGERRWPRWR